MCHQICRPTSPQAAATTSLWSGVGVKYVGNACAFYRRAVIHLPGLLTGKQVDALEMWLAADDAADAKALLLQGFCKGLKPAQ